MSLNDSLKCPGPGDAPVAASEKVLFPAGDVPDRITARQTQVLIDTAVCLGAGDARIIAPSDILVEDHLARLCNGDHQCENYGLSASCPPHVPGPAAFRKWRDSARDALVVRIDLPTEVMFSEARRDIMSLLHQVVAGVEKKAVEFGFTGARAFAGGSCKNLFCADHENCRVTHERKECRHPASARPSMSGFGINVARMMETAGWLLTLNTKGNSPDAPATSWVAGLVLISR